ncbi:MAG TPA: response regulator [Candidatus Kapabacteria bacterium]|nr:response regulator [Candidatus Kapabacteria bacterium]
MANVLLVDDEQNILLTYRAVLERGGHRVSTASTAEDALRSFENEGADVIVTDMNMPGISGIELVKKIRQRSPGTEIIVMTGAGSERTGIQAMQAGAYDYLRKADIVPDELVLLVEKAAEKAASKPRSIFTLGSLGFVKDLKISSEKIRLCSKSFAW